MTLIECLVVMAILAIMATVAVPSLQSQMASFRIQSQVKRLQSAVMLARTVARTDGIAVTLCPWNGEVCSGSYSDGVAVVAMVSAEPTLLQVFPGRPGLSVHNRSGDSMLSTPVRWNRYGLANRNLTMSVCSKGHAENWALVLNRLGRPRVVKDWGHCAR